jgi:hypothetical protein
MRNLFLLAALLGTACSGGSGARPSSAPRPDDSTAVGTPTTDVSPTAVASAARVRTLAADETITSASGATFTASTAWVVEERPDLITLTAPEGDLTLHLLELAAADRSAALAAAWAKVRPGWSSTAIVGEIA